MASAKRKERTLKELYTVTQMITKPEITPVLRGSFRMQGPVDETYSDIQTDMGDEKGLSRHIKSPKVLMRAESGMCNVCSAPCSSCLHIKRNLMGSKTDEFSDETVERNAYSQYSVNDVVPVKSTGYDRGWHTASETSNLLSVNSNLDSFSENAESKACLRTFDVSGASEDVEMHPNLSSGVTAGDDQLPSQPQCKTDQRTLANKLEDRKVIEGHGDNITSVSGCNDANKLAGRDMFCGQGSTSYACGGSEDGSLLGGNSASSEKLYINLEGEPETDKGSDDLPAGAVNFPEQIEEIEKVKESRVLPDLQETSLSSQHLDDSDGSDIVEHDVKVCDICGDAGREDLLAICSVCSDGAEHTYCMREMVDKVPEGDWLCEECKFDEESKNLKQDKIVTVHGNDKNQSSGLAAASNTNVFVKLDKKDSDAEGNKTNQDILNEKASSKRSAENIEVASAVKRQAVDLTVGSPKTSSPGRIAPLSRDPSFKNLDKGKVKPVHPFSSGTCAANDTSKAALSPTGSRPCVPRGTLLKSNSFNSTNAKPKLKLVDEVVLQKQKSARDFASVDVKSGAVRSIGKSMSFKSLNSGRSNPSESKVKMLSPKFSHGQDIKGLKQAKEWNLLERKNSFKAERSLGSSAAGNTTVSMLKNDKKLASCGESFSLPSVSNNLEPKGVQSDSKPSTLSKSTSYVARRGSGMPVSLGETKMQSCLLGVAGASSTNGISSSSEQKLNQSSLVYDPSSSAERPFCNANEAPVDVLSQPRESINLGETIRESSIYQSRHSIAPGGSPPCKSSKEIGHSTQSCTVENARSLLGDTSAARISREAMNKGNRLKAAIEAAMLKKPGIYRKNKMTGQSDELSMSSSSLNCEIRPQDQLSTSISTRNNFSSDEVQEGQAVLRNSGTELSKQITVNNMKPSSAFPSEAATWKTGDISPIDPSEGKPSISDLQCHASSAIPILKMSIIPEHEYIWQGGFEVQRGGKLPELHDGIQAHLSTCASPRVLEVVKKLPSKILLNEVPRLSTWPLQFQEIGVREDNIALYLFAKDLESYDESYKSLLDTMIKNDLALTGNFDSVELLIFPSNHLPEKFQRWNMLYFLWGVFRGKKVNCLQDVSGSPKKFGLPGDLPTTIIPLPESICSLGPMHGDLPRCSKVYNGALASACTASMESPFLSAENRNDNCDISASSFGPKGQCTQANARDQECRLDATSLSSIRKACALSFQQTICTRTPLEDVDTDCKLDVKPLPPVQGSGTLGSLKKSSDKMPTYLGNAPTEIRGGVNISEIQVTPERTLKEGEGYLYTKGALPKHEMMRDVTMKEVNNWQYTHGKRLHEDFTWTASQASAGISQSSSWNDIDGELLDGGCASKKQKTGHTGLYARNSSSSLGESLASGLRDMGTSSPIKEEMDKEACDEREVSRNNGTAERYFFPVDPHPVKKDLSLDVNNSIHWQVFESENDDRLPHGAPNLELALGADMESSKLGGNLPFLMRKDGQEDRQPPEKAAIKEEKEVDASACLSLSLAFPFSDKEPTVERVSKVNTSLLLFKGLSDN